MALRKSRLLISRGKQPAPPAAADDLGRRFDRTFDSRVDETAWRAARQRARAGLSFIQPNRLTAFASRDAGRRLLRSGLSSLRIPRSKVGIRRRSLCGELRG